MSERRVSKSRFIEAIEGGECPVCKIVEEKERGYIEEILMELVSDTKFRDRLQKSRGFCIRHFRKLLLMAEKRPDLNGIGISDMLRDLVEVEIRDLVEVNKSLAEIRSKAPMPMDKEWEKIVRALRKIFGRI
jgi:hypothetical protein